VVVDEFGIANPPTAETKQPCVSREAGAICPIVGAGVMDGERPSCLRGDVKAGIATSVDIPDEQISGSTSRRILQEVVPSDVPVPSDRRHSVVSAVQWMSDRIHLPTSSTVRRPRLFASLRSALRGEATAQV